MRYKRIIIHIAMTFLFFVTAGLSASSEPDKTAEDSSVSPQDTNEIKLRNQVEELLRGDNVLLRRQIDLLYQLAEIYEKKGRNDEAIELYHRALEVNSWNIPCQMHLANLLKKSGNTEEAVAKARIVYELAEDQKLVTEARALLKSGGHEMPEEKTFPADANVEIVLVPVGYFNYKLLHSLQNSLKEKMGINFTISDKTKSIGLVDRTFTSQFINNYFEWIKGIIDANAFSELITELGYTQQQLEDADAKKKFIYSFYEAVGEKGQEKFREFKQALTEVRSIVQYDTYRLLEEMQKEFPLQSNSAVKGYLAITDKDLYEGESNFLFGSAVPGYGIMSFHRFTGHFNGEDQNRPRLVNRTLKQAMSSTNFILGIPRCTNPNCVRAYPHSLQELDQKPDTLCPLCKSRLDEIRKACAAGSK